MIEAVRHNLANLLNLSGRDTRSTFWFYVLFLIIIQFIISFAISIFAGGAMMVDAIQSASGGVEEPATRRQMIVYVERMVRVSMWSSMLVSLLMTFLLAASFTRRLHDSNRPGWIAGLVVAMQLLSIGLTIGMVSDMINLASSVDPDQPEAMQRVIEMQQDKFALTGGVSWIPLLLVLIFGVWPSSDGDNRYGPEPEHI